LVVLLTFHFADLWRFAHWFIETYPRDDETPAFQAILDRELGNRRIAEEREDAVFSDEDRYDDAGGFDSIFLVRFDRGYLALAGEPANTNEQVFDASALPVHALEALGVGFVITTQERTDLVMAGKTSEANLYRVGNPAPRADFFGASRAEFADESQIPPLFAAGSWDRLILPSDAGKQGSRAEGGTGTVDYSRPSSDEIEVELIGTGPGFVHVLESYDPGWSATVDGVTAPVIPANGFEMAIPVRGGNSMVRLRYKTTGRATGLALSLLSLGLLVALLAYRTE
jgi:hypothetical protein